MEKQERTASNLELVGGRLCLDFANTVSTRIEALCCEYLTSYRELVAWGQHVDILTDAAAQALSLEAACHPELAAAALGRAIAVRETIYRIFSASADGQRPESVDVSALNATLKEALSRLQVSPTAGGFGWTWVVNENDLDRILWPVVHSAADLLTSDDLGRVRQCEREGCDWIFVDLSKNHSRRWCSMNLCGSRVKSQRYYYRKKGEGYLG
jgi:predicted RNA-binding Zn ribbon-like protein